MAALLQFIDIYANLLILLFVGYYFLKFHFREKELEKKEKKADTTYHEIVDDALTKERKIIDDATQKADQIISSAQEISLASKEVIHKSLQKMVVDIEKEALTTSREYLKSYQSSLHQIMLQSLKEFQIATKATESDHQQQVKAFNQSLLLSLTNFQSVAKEMELDLQKQMKLFHETMLPTLEKQLEEYKQSRFKESEQMITGVVQKVSQELLNKSISLDDHHALLIQALERAKKEGVFE